MHTKSWNQLPSSFRQPHSVHCPPGSPHPAHITSSQSPTSLSPFTTPSAFFSSFTNPLLHSLSGSIWTAFVDLGLGPDLVDTDVLYVLVSSFYIYSVVGLAC